MDKTEERNLQAVQQLSEATGEGNLETVSQLVTEDVDWQTAGLSADAVPWGGPHVGPQQVLEYFEQVRGAIEVDILGVMRQREYLARGDKVVALGHIRARVRSTGRLYESDAIQVYTLRDGKVAKYRNYVDTAAVAAAFRST